MHYNSVNSRIIPSGNLLWGGGGERGYYVTPTMQVLFGAYRVVVDNAFGHAWIMIWSTVICNYVLGGPGGPGGGGGSAFFHAFYSPVRSIQCVPVVCICNDIAIFYSHGGPHNCDMNFVAFLILWCAFSCLHVCSLGAHRV